MDVIFFDGFDYYETSYITNKWGSVSGSVAISTGSGRFGNGLSLIGNAVATSKTFKNISSPSIGHAFKVSELTSKTILTAYDGSNAQYYWEMTAGGHIVVKNGSGIIIGTSGATLDANKFYHVELHAPIGNSVTVTLRVNGGTAGGFVANNVDTLISPNAYINKIAFGSTVSGTIEISIDDLYVVDNSTPIGLRTIDTLYPNGGVQSWMQWSTVGTISGRAGSIYECINEHPPDENTTYVYTRAAGSVLAFFSEVDDIRTSTSGTVDAIFIHTLAAKGTTSDRRYKIGWWPSGGSVNINYGPEIVAAADFQYDSLLLGPVPGTLAGWGPANVNSLRIGARRTV